MNTTVTPLGIALRNIRIHSRSFDGIKIFFRMGDLIGDNLINELYRKMLKFDNPGSLILEVEYKFKGLILTKGRKLLKSFTE